MVFRQKPEQVHLLQGDNRVALRHPPQDDIRGAEKQLGIQHVAQLKGETVKIAFPQDRIIPQRCALRPIGDEEGVAVNRGAELCCSDKNGSECKGPEHQRVFHPPHGERITVSVKQIPGGEKNCEHDHVDKNVVSVKFDILPRDVIRIQQACLIICADRKVQNEREDKDQDNRGGGFLRPACYRIQSLALHLSSPRHYDGSVAVSIHYISCFAFCECFFLICRAFVPIRKKSCLRMHHYVTQEPMPSSARCFTTICVIQRVDPGSTPAFLVPYAF